MTYSLADELILSLGGQEERVLRSLGQETVYENRRNGITRNRILGKWSFGWYAVLINISSGSSSSSFVVTATTIVIITVIIIAIVVAVVVVVSIVVTTTTVVYVVTTIVVVI